MREVVIDGMTEQQYFAVASEKIAHAKEALRSELGLEATEGVIGRFLPLTQPFGYAAQAWYKGDGEPRFVQFVYDGEFNIVTDKELTHV